MDTCSLGGTDIFQQPTRRVSPLHLRLRISHTTSSARQPREASIWEYQRTWRDSRRPYTCDRYGGRASISSAFEFVDFDDDALEVDEAWQQNHRETPDAAESGLREMVGRLHVPYYCTVPYLARRRALRISYDAHRCPFVRFTSLLDIRTCGWLEGL